MLNYKKSTLGFTLLEILLVVGIIAVLAGIVIIAINPSRQLAFARNTERKSDIKQIKSAMEQFYIDKGYYPASTTLSATTSLQEICDTGATSSPSGVTCTDMLDLSELVPVYITAIPKDPQATTTNSAGYKVVRHSSGKIGLKATAELGQIITLNIPPEEVVVVNNYTITYNGNTNTGGSVPTDSGSYASGATVTVLGNTGALTKTGYSFAGWNTQADGGGTTRAVASTFAMDSGNLTLYARWQTTVACVANGGTLYNGYCWYEGALGETCTTVCSARGGNYSPTCNEDSSGNGVCISIHGGPPSNHGNNAWTMGPQYYPPSNSCRYSEPMTDCSSAAGSVEFTRFCVCVDGMP